MPLLGNLIHQDIHSLFLHKQEAERKKNQPTYPYKLIQERQEKLLSAVRRWRSVLLLTNFSPAKQLRFKIGLCMTSVGSGHEESGQPLEKPRRLFTATAEKAPHLTALPSKRSDLLRSGPRLDISRNSSNKQNARDLTVSPAPTRVYWEADQEFIQGSICDTSFIVCDF